MRILTLIYEYPPVGGGGGRAAQDICQGLVKRGHQVKILTAHWGDLPFREEQNGLEIIRIKSLRRLPYKADLKAMMGFVTASLFSAPGIIHRWKPDVLHVHFAVPTGASAFCLRLLTGQPYVLTAHLGDVPGGVPEKTGGWFRWIYPFTPPIWKTAAEVVAVSEFTRSIALKHYDVPIQVIPNGVDLENFDPGEIKVSTPPRIFFAGRFAPQKNLIEFVRILAGLTDLEWDCVMLGDGPLRPEIEKEIAQYGMQDRFTLPGWVTQDRVMEWLQRSDILFMPSLSEGLPVTGVQAVAMGLAAVLSRAGGNIELVEEGKNGFLLDIHDNNGYQQALRRLLEDRSTLKACRHASRQLASRFDIRSIARSYETLFEQVIQKK